MSVHFGKEVKDQKDLSNQKKNFVLLKIRGLGQKI